MRKLYLIPILFFCLNFSYGQKVAPTPHKVTIPYNTSHLRQPTDTLFGQLDEWQGAFFIPLDTGGYFAGNNGYGDLQKAQVFQIQGQFTIEQCIVWFGQKNLESNDQNSSIDIHIMSLNGPGINANGPTQNEAPDSILATFTLSAADIDTAQGFWNIITFATPTTVTGNFAVSVDFSTLADGDTATLVHSQDGAGNIFNDLAWEQQSDSVWVSFAWDGAGGWGQDIQLGIFPIGEEIVGVNELGKLAFKLYPAFPNPMRGIGYIFYELNEPAQVSVEIIDITGKTIAIYNEGYRPEGKSMVSINAADFSNGAYFYGIRIQDQVVFKKFVVVK
ncbi:MAG: T9SS type A sorting domain-containing protein [Bacteroidetes bacterium]|nr:T9SS type A sorting domain-containing protein [Bacteroidota bacterium]